MHLLSTREVMTFAFLMGAFGGLRTLTPLAVLSWAAFKHRLQVEDTQFFFLSRVVSVVIFSLMAMGELVADKLPSTPSRRRPPGFLTRVAVGAFSGMVLCEAQGLPLLPMGAGIGILGAIAGTLLGYEARTRLIKLLRAPDWTVAVVEDAIAIGGCAWVVLHF